MSEPPDLPKITRKILQIPPECNVYLAVMGKPRDKDLCSAVSHADGVFLKCLLYMMSIQTRRSS